MAKIEQMKHDITDCMFVSFSNSYADIQILNLMVFGGGVLGDN